MFACNQKTYFSLLTCSPDSYQVFYRTRGGKCSPLPDPSKGVTPALFPLISTSTHSADRSSSTVRGHIQDFEPLPQEHCVNVTAGGVNAVANALR